MGSTGSNNCGRECCWQVGQVTNGGDNDGEDIPDELLAQFKCFSPFTGDGERNALRLLLRPSRLLGC